MPARLSQEDYIAACEKKHGKRYKYKKTVYNGSASKVVVTCREHGDFLIIADNHKR